MTAPFRALVADDEAIARLALRDLLTLVPWIEWAGEAADGTAALTAIGTLKPDLLFLDVRMPAPNGIEVAERAGPGVAVIFTTAHDEYAMTAFELGAIDYLHKPFGRERFMRAVERARPQLEDSRARRADGAGSTLAERLAFAQEPVVSVSRIFVRDRGAVRPVSTADIVRCEADGDYVAVYAQGRRFLVYVNLGDLAARLDPQRFVRVHRSHVVNLDWIAEIVPRDASRLHVKMKDGSEVTASRAGTQALRARVRG